MNSHHLLFSATTLSWMVTIAVLGLASTWTVWEFVRLGRFVPRGKAAHDEIFGSVIGLICAMIAFGGVFLFHFGG